jgi:hypothetical protein
MGGSSNVVGARVFRMTYDYEYAEREASVAPAAAATCKASPASAIPTLFGAVGACSPGRSANLRASDTTLVQTMLCELGYLDKNVIGECVDGKDPYDATTQAIRQFEDELISNKRLAAGSGEGRISPSTTKWTMLKDAHKAYQQKQCKIADLIALANAPATPLTARRVALREALELSYNKLTPKKIDKDLYQAFAKASYVEAELEHSRLSFPAMDKIFAERTAIDNLFKDALDSDPVTNWARVHTQTIWGLMGPANRAQWKIYLEQYPTLLKTEK